MYLPRQRRVLSLHTVSGAPALDQNPYPPDRYFFWVDDYKTLLIGGSRQLTPSPVMAPPISFYAMTTSERTLFSIM